MTILAIPLAFKGDVLKSFLNVQEEPYSAPPFSCSLLNFVGDFVQGCFSEASLSEGKMTFVMVYGDVEVMLPVP